MPLAGGTPLALAFRSGINGELLQVELLVVVIELRDSRIRGRRGGGQRHARLLSRPGGAMSRHARVDRLDVVSMTTSLLGLSSELDDGRDGRSIRRQALRHLAAGVVDWSAGAWILGLRYLGVATCGAWRSALLPPQLRSSALLLLPRWLTRSAGALSAASGCAAWTCAGPLPS